jgi:hypothetical protein
MLSNITNLVEASEVDSGTKKVHILAYNEKAPLNAEALNCTTTSTSWTRAFSPDVLGPVYLFGDEYACNLGNAWRYLKTYKSFYKVTSEELIDESGETVAEDSFFLKEEEYLRWAREGWRNENFSNPSQNDEVLGWYWNGEVVSDKIDARIKIFIPLYARLVHRLPEYYRLVEMYNEGSIYLRDHKGSPYTTLDSLITDSPKFGCAQVLALMLNGAVKVSTLGSVKLVDPSVRGDRGKLLYANSIMNWLKGQDPKQRDKAVQAIILMLHVIKKEYPSSVLFVNKLSDLLSHKKFKSAITLLKEFSEDLVLYPKLYDYICTNIHNIGE